jgi:putative RecB family exonuclease
MTLYSYSRLNTFKQCRLKYKYQYIDKIKTEIKQTVEAFLGSMVHQALEKLYKDLKFQNELSKEELIAYFHKIWKENWADDILIVRKEYTIQNFIKMGEKFLSDYYTKYNPFDQGKTIGLETGNTAKLDEKDSIHIKIDRLVLRPNDTYEIHDYKTANSLPTQEIVDKDEQLAIYAYGIKQMYPEAKKIKLIWHYLAFDKEMVSIRTDEQIMDLKKEIILLINEIEQTTDFPPTSSALCNWCNFRALCPMCKHQYETEKLSENEFCKEDGVTLVKRYVELNVKKKDNDQKIEKVREALLKYSQDKKVDNVYGETHSLAIRTYPRLSFPKKGEVLQASFFDEIKKAKLWEELETINVYELAKKINSGQVSKEILELLNPFITKGETTKFYLRKR